MTETTGATGTGGRGEPSESYDGHSDVDELAVRLADLARDLHNERDVQRTLDTIVAAVVETVPGAEQASLSSIARRREVDVRAASGDPARALSRLEVEVGEGPCLDTLFAERTVRLDDMADEPRWPRFAAQARERGVASMLALQLYVEGDDLGVLNLAAERPRAFTDESERIGLLFAAHAAIAMSNAQVQEQLRAAMDTRDLIGTAKGILVERHKITDDQAFTVLVRVSQDTNRKLREVADTLVRSGELPQRPRRGGSAG